jgi:hypothetical protein
MIEQPSSSAHDELAYIRQIIDNSRLAFVEDGKPYILWGILVPLGMTVTYISALQDHDYGTGYVWIGLTLCGWIYVAWYSRHKVKTQRARSILDRIQSAVWGAIGSMIGLLIVMIYVGHSFGSSELPGINPFYICSLTAILIGIGYFLSGIANDLRWLRNVAFAWWAGAVVMYLWPSIHVLGLYALMIVLFQVVPGIVLYRAYRTKTASPSTATIGMV